MWVSLFSVHTFAWTGIRGCGPTDYVTTEAEFKDVVRQVKQLGMDFENYFMYNIIWFTRILGNTSDSGCRYFRFTSIV
ncbi:MAG: hypothetical protein RMI56_03810 [Sulfolobales archaeon]|nr:hypothetical protein [Sulfolobales archaeon]MDW8082908.1 hypothetical protein [Sulfolobales archaeon]